MTWTPRRTAHLSRRRLNRHPLRNGLRPAECLRRMAASITCVLPISFFRESGWPSELRAPSGPWLGAWLPNLVFSALGLWGVNRFNKPDVMSFSIPPLDPLLDERESLRVLYRISSILHSPSDPSEALSLIVRRWCPPPKRTPARSPSSIPPMAFSRSKHRSDYRKAPINSCSRWGKALRDGLRNSKPICTNNAPDDPRFILAGDGTKSELAVPMEVDGT